MQTSGQFFEPLYKNFVRVGGWSGCVLQLPDTNKLREGFIYIIKKKTKLQYFRIRGRNLDGIGENTLFPMSEMERKKKHGFSVVFFAFGTV